MPGIPKKSIPVPGNEGGEGLEVAATSPDDQIRVGGRHITVDPCND
jgi:hypothetical protein